MRIVCFFIPPLVCLSKSKTLGRLATVHHPPIAAENVVKMATHQPPVVDQRCERTAPEGSSAAWAAICFSGGTVASEEELQNLVTEAADSAKNEFDEKSAVRWADGYTFPPSYMASDQRCLQAAQLDFSAMVRRRLKTLSPHRLSVERVRGLREDNPELSLMMDLADGMRVHLPAGFTPNGKSERTPLRSAYVTVHTAVHKMLGEIVHQKLAFLLPLAVAQRYVPRLHLCKAHWTRKKGKASGRPLGDLSFVDGDPINTPETATAAATYYGEIVHPTIEDIANMVNFFWDQARRRNPFADWSKLRIWKMDLKGAYTLLSFRPDDVGLFGMLLTEEVVYLQVAGIFGWAGTPAAFQVVTRAISWELKHKLRSSTLMYVDDIIGVGFDEDIERDMASTRAVCTALLGPTAVADEKSEVGRRIDIIGYIIDLDLRRILIAKKNFLTALNGYMTADLDAGVDLRSAQRLASWSSRYGKICRVMRPFCGALNRLTTGRTSPHAVVPLSNEAKVAIKCWRAMLCLVRYSEARFTRSLASFTIAPSHVVAEFDASLSGAGLIWYDRSSGAEVAVGVCAVDISSLGFNDDSSFQNLAEFIGAIIAVVGHIRLGYMGQSRSLRGDSMAALTWAITERTRGSISTNAAMIWTLLCVYANIDIAEAIHIPGKENGLCDRLSRRRGSSQPVESEARSMGLGKARVIDMQEDSQVIALLTMCDPKVVLSSDKEFVDFWCSARRVVEFIVTPHLTPSHNPSQEIPRVPNY